MPQLEILLLQQETPAKEESRKKSEPGAAKRNSEDEEEPSLLQVSLCECLNGEDRRDNANGAEGHEKEDAQREAKGAGRCHGIRAGYMLTKDTA
jgi:hypothetical protein